MSSGILRIGLVLGAVVIALPSSAIRFETAAERWGIDFRHHIGASGVFYMPETMGSGLVVFDYDADGDHDLFFVDSGEMPGYEGEPARSVLYRNDQGRFLDVAHLSGVDVASYGMGATAGDVDGDGDLDLYVTAFGVNRLFLNRGDGTFEDATAAAGVGDELWSASATFCDTDRDGDLDLYVTNYVDFSYDDNPPCGIEERGLRSYCHPDVYDGLPDRFYRNRGDGTFVDATASAGFGEASGKGLGVVCTDLDGDDWPEIYVANDMTPNFLFANRGDGTFDEMALEAGAAVSDLGEPEAGMGVDVGDLDGDGQPDIFLTHLDLQTNALYRNLGSLLFVDHRYPSRLAEASVYEVGFGTAFADFDQDGDLDVVVANGHIIHNIEQFERGTTYAQRNQVFENTGGGRFEEVSESGMDAVRVSRGLAVGDLDGDGDVDVVISNSNDLAEVYENVTDSQAGWLGVDLRAPGGNTHGVGASVVFNAGTARQQREMRTASSYLSQNAMTLHFGLGDHRHVGLDVTWPSGQRQRFVELPANRRVVLVPAIR